MDFEDEIDGPITIDHLLGNMCVYNGCVTLTLRAGADGQLELVGDDEIPIFRIVEILAFHDDGGFIVDVVSKRSGNSFTHVHLISKEVYDRSSTKRQR